MSFGDLHARVRRLGLICVIVCPLLVPIFSGCAKAMPTSEPVTITFAHPTSDADYYQALAQKFNESYPHVTVELRPERGGQQVDVFTAPSFALSQLQERGDILSLDPFIEQDASFDVSDFYPGTVGLYTSEGKVWAIPAGVNTMVMFYNQDLFDQYAVPYPEIGWTWDDFLNAALAIRDPEANVFGYAPTPQSFGPLSFIYQHGGRIFDDLQNPTRTTFEDPLTIEALDWYAKLINEHDVAPTPEQTRRTFGTSRNSIYRGILQDKVGMWIGVFSEQGGLTWPVEWDMRWGMMPLPRDAQSVTGAEVEGYFISSQTRHPDACWQWIAFLSKQIPHRLMPARKSLAQSNAYEQQVGDDIAAVARASMESAVMITPDLAEFEEAMDVFYAAVEEVINGRSTPEEAMSWAQQQAEK